MEFDRSRPLVEEPGTTVVSIPGNKGSGSTVTGNIPHRAQLLEGAEMTAKNAPYNAWSHP